MKIQDKYKMEVVDNTEYAKRMIVDSIYKEAQIEGIAVTFLETEQIYDGITVEGMRFEDAEKIVNLKRAWFFILDNLSYPVDLNFIRHVNSLVQNGLSRNAGIIREFSVAISGTSWIPSIPSLEKIQNELEEIRRIENSTDRALELMLHIMKGQWFEDGNKRTAQIVANHEMIRSGVGIVAIPKEKKREFGDLLISYYEKDENEELKDFLYRDCVTGYNRDPYIL